MTKSRTGLHVNIAVCGKFHYPNYVGLLAASGDLGKFYYSHRINANKELNLDPTWAENLFLKEYLQQLERRLIGDRIAQWSDPITGVLWSSQVLLRWQPADVLHFLSHGHCLQLIKRARGDGAKIISEMVNTHPSNSLRIYLEQCEQFGIRPARTDRSDMEKRLIEEAQSADLLLVPSEPVQQSFLNMGFAAPKIVKLPYAANLDRFFIERDDYKKGRPSKPLKVVCVGHIGLRKGQLYLLEAAKRLGPSIVDLTLIGSINYEIAHLIPQYRECFKHYSHIDNRKLRSILAEHDVFVLPTLEEGMAVSNCEALASGLCVITTRESGAEEVINHGRNGLIVESASTEAIEAQLVDLYSDRAKVSMLGQTAALSMRDYHNWNTYAEELSASAYRHSSFN